MKTTKNIVRKVQANGNELAGKGKKIVNRGKDIANMGTEAVEKAYKTAVDMLSHAKQDAPSLVSNLVKKGEQEWDEARKVIDKLYQDRKDKLFSLRKDLMKSLEEVRDHFIKELPVDLTVLQDILKKIEETFGKLDLPFIKNKISDGIALPLADYDHMTVKQILPKLEGLTPVQLQAVLTYEENHQNRVSLTREIKKLLA